MFFAETVSAKKSKGEVLVFRRQDLKKNLAAGSDIENGKSAILVEMDTRHLGVVETECECTRDKFWISGCGT